MKKMWLKLVALVLVVSTLLTAMPLTAFAEEIKNDNTEVYVSEIKLFRAATYEDALKLAGGYELLEANLNEGTDGDGIWLGYKGTYDPTQAIYDIKLVNMKGGFTRTSMEKALEAQKSALSEMATDLKYLVDEFVEAYHDGTAPAMSAYKALNFFRVTDGEGEIIEEYRLGYQIVNGGVTLDMLTEILLLCDPNFVDTIVKILTMGIQTRNENWLEELSQIGPYNSETEYMEDEDELLRRAEQLLSVLSLYSDIYNTMEQSGLLPDGFDEDMNPIYNQKDNDPDTSLAPEDLDLQKADEARYKFYKLAADELAKYPYGEEGETFLDFFKTLADEEDEKLVYPLVSVLSKGEFSALSYGCFLEMVTAAGATEDDYACYDEVYDELTANSSSVYLYLGVDKALLNNEAIVGFTDTAQRHMAQTGDLNFFESDNVNERTWSDAVQVVKCIGVACLAVVGLTKIGVGIVGTIAGVSAATAATQSAAVAATIKYGTMIGGLKGLIVAVVIVVVCLLVSYVVAVVKDNWSDNIDWDDDPLLDYMYDVKEVSLTQTSDDGVKTNPTRRAVYTLYEAVTDLNGNPMDLNAFYGEGEWLQMFVSYDKQGDDAKPIKADSLMAQYGDGQTPDGYVPMTRFGETYAYNLNAGDLEDRVNGIYMFYQQDRTVAVDSNVTYYISDVRLQSGESDAHCIKLLQDSGFVPLNINLSPDLTDGDLMFEDKIYTYIGYKVTTSPDCALRDIRLVYGPDQGAIQFGAATYASSGSNGVVTLYSTKYEISGTPILADSLICVERQSDAPLGYEPVCLMAGGPAVPVNVNTDGEVREDNGFLYLYFLPETSFTSGKQYLGGIAMLLGGVGTYDALNRNIKTQDAVYELFGGYVSAAGDDRDIDRYVNVVAYYPTYNPYRAIYSIKAVELDDYANAFSIEGNSYYMWNKINWGYHAENNSVDKLSVVIQTMGVDAYKDNGAFYLSGNPELENVYVGNKPKEETEEDTEGEEIPDPGVMSGVEPMELSDVLYFTSSGPLPTVPDGYYPVVNAFQSFTEWPMWYHPGSGGYYFVIYTKDPNEERPYISSVLAIDHFSIYRSYGGYEKGVTLNQISDTMLYSYLVSNGANEIIGFAPYMQNTTVLSSLLGVLGHMNTTRFGVTRVSADSTAKALTDVFLYFNEFSTDAPPKEIYRGSVKYSLLTEIPYNLMSYDDAPHIGVYLYGTTSSKAGSKIIDFQLSSTPYMEGYETIRTKDGRSLYSEIKDYAKYQQNSNPMGEARDFFEALYKFFDNDDNYKLLPYYYLHIKRETDNKGDDLYIEKVYLANASSDKATAIDSLFDQGAEGFVDVSLNQGSGGSPTYLGYSYTHDPEKAIKEIRAYHEKSHPNTLTDGNGRKFTLVDDIDLNKGAGTFSDYIYLYTTTETAGDRPITEVSVSFNIQNYGKLGGYTTNTTKKWNSDSYSDLNDGGGGEYVYLLYTTVFDSPLGEADPEINYGEDKTYSREGYESQTAKGKYIGGIYLMDKETIRLERIANGTLSDTATCNDITDEEVFARLTAMGATEIVKTPINASNSGYFKNNANKVFLGYSRTNKSSMAIRNLAIKIEMFAMDEPKEEIVVKSKPYTLVAEAAEEVTSLPKAINLIGIEGSTDLNLPRFYLYYSTATGSDPIYDIRIDDVAILNGWNTVRSTNQLEPFADVYKQACDMRDMADDDGALSMFEGVYHDELSSWMSEIAELFDPINSKAKPFYIHVKRYAETSIEDVKPYIGEIFVANGRTKEEALSKLVAYDPDGYIECDLNMDAGERHWYTPDPDVIYIAYKRVAKSKDALTDLVVYEGEKFEPARTITINGNNVKYTLVSDVNLNKDVKGKHLYLYSANSKYAGTPIMDLYCKLETPSIFTQCGVEHSPVKRADGNVRTDEIINFNKDAGGKTIYMVMERESEGGHYWGLPTNRKTKQVAATCGEDGYLLWVYDCVLCGEHVEQVVKVYPATGEHVDADGDWDHDCDVCGTEGITDHIPGEVQQEGLKKPTCIAKGSYYDVIYCVECEEELSATIVYTDIDPNNHKDGKDKDHNCDLCGALNIEDHTPGKPVEENRIEPTEDTDGSYKKVIYCTECGEIISEETIVIPALNKPEPNDSEVIASLFSNGSVVIICSLFGLAVLAAVIMYLQKKKKSNKGENEDE